MAFPAYNVNDFTNIVISSLDQEYAIFRVFKHYVVDEVDHHRMVQYIVSRDEVSEGLEIVRDTTDTDKVTLRIFSRDRIMLMDWSTDTDGANLTDGNTVSNFIASGTWEITGEPSGDVFTDIEDAIYRILNWIQYVP